MTTPTLTDAAASPNAVDPDSGLLPPRIEVHDGIGLPSATTEKAIFEEVFSLCPLKRRAINLCPDRPSRTTALSRHFCYVESFDFDRNRLTQAADMRLRGTGLHRQVLLARREPVYIDRDDPNAGLLRYRQGNAERVPVTPLDDFGWTDVDLIVVSRRADLAPLLAGGRQTFSSQRPPILIFARAISAPAMTAMIRELGALFELGYVVAATYDQALFLHARDRAITLPPPAPAMTKVSGLSGKDQIMVIDIPEDCVQGATSDHALVGRTLVPTQLRQFNTTGGVRHLARIHLARSVKTEGFAGLRLSNRKLVQFPDLQDTVSIESLVARTSLTTDAAGLSLGFPAELAAIATDYAVTLTFGEGDACLVAQGDFAHGQTVNDIRLAWPLNAIRADTGIVRVDVFMDGRQIGSCSTEHDFLHNHISPDTVRCYLNHGGGGNPAVSALAESLGCRTRFAEDGFRPGIALVWGVLRGSKAVLDEAARRGSIFYYMDHAYLNRGHGKAYRITRQRFEAGPVRDCPDDRLKALAPQIAAWQPEGRFIVVCPPTAYFMEAHGCHDWLETTLATLRRYTDREIIIREKPASGHFAPLAEALDGAHALVTHSSNVAVEAAMLGTPVFVSEFSAARPVGLSDLSLIEAPVRPDRDKWLAHLAYSQFAFEELQSGECWRLLAEFEQRPLL